MSLFGKKSARALSSASSCKSSRILTWAKIFAWAEAEVELVSGQSISGLYAINVGDQGLDAGSKIWMGLFDESAPRIRAMLGETRLQETIEKDIHKDSQFSTILRQFQCKRCSKPESAWEKLNKRREVKTTNSDSGEPRFGSEASEVGRCVWNWKSSVESVVKTQNLEVGSRIQNNRRKDRRMTAQEVLAQSESANNSSEEKSKIMEKRGNLRCLI
ncbi:hypothetical protein DFH06DRAFT_1419720 [Mycena polygramma]|nr:hypothetical protein DFH06DRAFT_1419720 [Mycena polygramma]